MWSSPSPSVRMLRPVDNATTTAATLKLAAFDMDSTLITPKDRTKTFGADRNDWMWFSSNVPAKLRELHFNGYQIVIFSNQGGVSKGTRDLDEITGKFGDIAAALGDAGVPVIAFISLEHDNYRKPAVGMYRLLAATLSDDVFYCGDAAGRHAGWDGNKQTKKDFSCSDRKFAANIGARFVTPEELFFGQPPTDKWSWGGVNPRELLLRYSVPAESVELIKPLAPPDQELVVMVGCPASGKSTYAKTVFSQYVRVSNDDLGTKQKCLKVAATALAAKKSVVVDNTNATLELRKEWLDLARRHKLETIRCVLIDTPRDVAQHMNAYREATAGVKRIPDIVYNVFFSKFVEPSTKEGFTEVHRVPFTLHRNAVNADQLLQWT